MAVDNKDGHPHIFPADTGESRSYTSLGGGGGKRISPPPRDRHEHANKLSENLARAAREFDEMRQRAEEAGIEREGDLLSFDLVLNPKLNLDSLESRRAGTKLLSFRATDEDHGVATVFVPEGQLEVFERKLEEYRTKETPNGHPKHQPLVNSVDAINRAYFEDLWTDPLEQEPPASDDKLWWEIWVRDEVGEDEFRAQAKKAGLRLKDQVLRFPGRLVFVGYASPREMIESVELLDALAEVRRARRVDHEFPTMSRREERKWCENFVKRTTPAAPDAPHICLLDTGVDHGHLLLSHSISGDDVHAYDPRWRTNDHYSVDGHGTPMAGFALYADHLAEYLASRKPLELRHRLESVKILPPGDRQNDPESYGEITQSAVAIVESVEPFRRRVFSMAITSTAVPDGSPSSWSAAVDQICSGAIEEDRPRRLFFVSAGDADWQQRSYIYPDSNHTDYVQDPAQAWNAVTVGAFTDQITIEPPEDYPDWMPVAPAGDMSPSNTTSLVWEDDWPSKPDIVLEGGNLAWAPELDTPIDVDSLWLLTSRKQQFGGMLTTLSGETSAATSIAANMAARIYAEYPDLWPETVRGLMIHSARWTPQMEAQFGDDTPRVRMRKLLRCYGYGVPSLRRAVNSMDNAVTLVVEDELKPFKKDGSRYKTDEMKLHRLPWPDAALEQLGDTQVRLRVTLSYFIEPNPAKRGWTRRYRYMSHGLRFALRTPEESDEHFLKRINKDAREEGEKVKGGADPDDWRFWEEAERGSIHQDVWEGPAAKLLERNLIAVVPVIGWWREYTSQNRYDRTARYSLIVSIETDETDVDLYAEIQNQVEVSTEIEV